MNTKVNGSSAIMFTMVNFGNWLLELLQEENMSQSELARLANLSKGTISNLINGIKTPSQETLTAIARALKLPPETVFRAAGLLPPQSPESEVIQQAAHLMLDLPEQEQLDILEFIKLRHRLAEERGKNGTRRHTERTVEAE